MRYFFTTFVFCIVFSILCSSGLPEPNVVEDKDEKEGTVI